MIWHLSPENRSWHEHCIWPFSSIWHVPPDWQGPDRHMSTKEKTREHWIWSSIWHIPPDWQGPDRHMSTKQESIVSGRPSDMSLQTDRGRTDTCLQNKRALNLTIHLTCPRQTHVYKENKRALYLAIHLTRPIRLTGSRQTHVTLSCLVYRNTERELKI